jgi:AraC-like DNA-binding protein
MSMRYVTHPPAPPLDAFVENLRALHDAPLHSRERIVPSGTLELVINLAEDEIRVYHANAVARYPGVVVSGAYRRGFVVDTCEHASLVGVHFRPGGARPFLGVRADALSDGHVALADLWSPGEANRLREQLCEATSTADRFRLLEDALRTHLLPTSRRRAVEVALGLFSRGEISVGEAARRAGFSHRYFIDLFAAEVGMTPKLFLRIQRFQRAFAQIGRLGQAQRALACGYFDQSDLIRDFSEFAGITPAEYARLHNDHVKRDHIALDA